VGVIQDIEELRPELYIEALRNSPDVVVLEYGKVQIRQARSHQRIAAGIASKVVATQIPERGPDARRRRVAVGCPKSLVWRHRHREATGLDVQRALRVTVKIQVNRIASGHDIRISIIVAAERTPGIRALRPQKSAEGNTVIGLEDGAQLPSAQGPRQCAGYGFGTGDQPSGVDH